MTAHDDLRRQLLDSVAAHAHRGLAPRSAGDGRPRRRRIRRRGLLVAVLALAAGGGVAGAATQLLRRPGDGDRARVLVRRAMAQTNERRACEGAVATFANLAPARQIESALPSRAAPAGPALRALARRYSIAPGTILSRTIRLARFPGGEQMLAYVSQGSGFMTQRDALGCDRLQRARLEKLHPRHDAVHVIAVRLLAHRQVQPAVKQTLWLGIVRAGHGRLGLLQGHAVDGAHPLTTRLSPYRESRSSTVFAGLAARGARTVRIATRRAAAGHAVRRSIAVRQGLIAFTLPGATGPVEVRELAADGRILATRTLRR